MDRGMTSVTAAQRPAFSRRLAAHANATDVAAGTDSKTQKSYDLARRKAVGWNAMLGGTFRLVYGLMAQNWRKSFSFEKRNLRKDLP
jgi:hypothetical protein